MKAGATGREGLLAVLSKLGLVGDRALVGVVARNGAGIALVHLAEGRTLQLREGDQLGPWVVKWIGDRSAVFRQGRHDVELTLDFKRPPAAPGGN